MIGNNNPRKGLQELFSLSEEQAQAILDLRIRVFGEERKKLYEDRRDCEDRLRIFRMVPKEERETWETISKAYYKLVKNFYSIKEGGSEEVENREDSLFQVRLEKILDLDRERRTCLEEMSDWELQVLVGVMYYGRECTGSGMAKEYRDCQGPHELFKALVPGWPEGWYRGRALDTLMGKICLGEYLDQGIANLRKYHNHGLEI